MKVNLARLNHILLPATRDERDRLRRSPLFRALLPLVFLYEALSVEGRLLAGMCLVAGVLGLDVSTTDAYLLWAVSASLLTASLVATQGYALGGVRLEARAPERVAVGETATFTLVLRNDGLRAHGTVRLAGPFLPWDGRYVGASSSVPRIAPASEARAEIRARFVQRGEHHLDPFRAAALVPLGLTLGPSLRSNACRFVVVPRIANVARVTPPLGNRHQPGGVAMASKTGESMDLLGVRQYRAGDPMRDLHARSWARTGIPVVREYQQEYFSRIGVVLDTESADDPDKLEAAISLAAGVVAHLSRGEALIDLLVVGDHVHDLTLGRSCGFLDQALDLLACVEPVALPEPAALSARLAPFLPRLSCMLLVACAWDARRSALAEQLRGFGPGVTTLLVTDTDTDTDAPAPDVRSVSVGAIARGERLAL